ncbi:MAG: GNAT family N-acetyltransferase [Chloroflexi bacterium]|nr:GNAT family N-acetyltransferase [Chloroflexota bacterium]
MTEHWPPSSSGRPVNLRPELDSGDAQRLLMLALDNPSPTRLEEMTQVYRFLPEWHVYGYRIGGDVVALIGVQLLTFREGVIQHLVVLPDYRRQGIGRTLVGHVLKRHALHRLSAECDASAADFFRACGAAVSGLASSNTRYQCVWDVAQAEVP